MSISDVRLSGENKNMTKEDFIKLFNDYKIRYSQMAREERISHIRNIQSALAKLRTLQLAADTSEREYLQSLDEAERARLREIDKKENLAAKIDERERVKVERETAQEKAIKKMMKDFGIPREKAESIIFGKRV